MVALGKKKSECEFTSRPQDDSGRNNLNHNCKVQIRLFITQTMKKMRILSFKHSDEHFVQEEAHLIDNLHLVIKYSHSGIL